MLAAERTIPEFRDSGGQHRSAVRIDRCFGQTARALVDLAHQIVPNGVTRVGDAFGRAFVARHQQQFRRLDGIRGEHHDTPGGRPGAAVWSQEMHGRDPVVGIRLDPMDDCVGLELGSRLLCLGRMNTRVVFGTDWAERDATGTAATSGPLVVVHTVASLRENSQRHAEWPENLLDDRIKIGRRNRRHRIVGLVGCPPILGLRAGYAQGLFGFLIERG